MAFADKITTMKRMAIIVPSGHIMWEGVNIEGICLLRSPMDGEIMVKLDHKLDRWIKIENTFGVGYKRIYLDPINEDHWEPGREEKNYNMTELVVLFLKFLKLDQQETIDDALDWIEKFGIEWNDITEDDI